MNSKDYNLPKTREEKIKLIKAIQRGDIKPGDLLTDETFKITLFLDGEYSPEEWAEKVKTAKKGQHFITLNLNA